MLDGGGDPNVADELGRSPLHIAAKTGDITSVNLLLERGAMIDAVEKVRMCLKNGIGVMYVQAIVVLCIWL